MHAKEPQPRSASYARELAVCLDLKVDEGIKLGPTDIEYCAEALRSHARRGLRRATFGCLCAAAVTFVAAVGLPDRNGDGRADFADIAIVAREIVGLVPTFTRCAQSRANRKG